MLNNDEELYRVLLPSYVGLLEEHARNLIEELISQKNVAASKFGNRNATAAADQIAEAYIRNTNVETWGRTILQEGGRNWNDVEGGLLLLVEVFVARNLVAHGLKKFNVTSINRLQGLNAGAPRVSTGQLLKLNKSSFQEYLFSMRAFARTMADAVANLR